MKKSQKKKSKHKSGSDTVKKAYDVKQNNKRKRDGETVISNAVHPKKLKSDSSDSATNKQKSKMWHMSSKRQRLQKMKLDRISSIPHNFHPIKDNKTGKNSENKQMLQINKQTPNAKWRKPKKKIEKDKNENESTGTTVKVQTHAALYRNPEEFSSNWKKLMQVYSTQDWP